MAATSGTTFRGAVVFVCVAVLVVACGASSTSRGAPTSKPTPSPTPQTAEGLVNGLKSAGLPVGATAVYTADNDPNKLLGRPHQYTSKANWQDTRIPPGSMNVSDGGSIETFSNKDDLVARAKYVEAIAKSNSLFAEYDYVSQRGLFFLRLGSKLTPDQAASYVDALKKTSPDLKGPA